MPMTGVIPEPAVTSSSFCRRPATGGASTKSPSAWASWTSWPARASRTRVLRDGAVGDRLDGDRDVAVAARAVGQRVGAPQSHAVDVDADPDVLPGDVGRPSRDRA